MPRRDSSTGSNASPAHAGLRQNPLVGGKYGVADLHVGAEAELVVETLYADETGDRTIWRWKPVTEMGEESDQ